MEFNFVFFTNFNHPTIISRNKNIGNFFRFKQGFYSPCYKRFTTKFFIFVCKPFDPFLAGIIANIIFFKNHFFINHHKIYYFQTLPKIL